MKYFLDTEFIENGSTIDLISIGIAAEDGRTLYKQNVECDFSKASDWVWRNVFPHLSHFSMKGCASCKPLVTPREGLRPKTNSWCDSGPDNPCPWARRSEIKELVLEFCNIEKFGKPEFWGYFADYDWVAFCQLFGTMIELPKGFPMYCNDIKQFCNLIGNPQLPKPEVEIHHALVDAQWNQEAYKFLMEKSADIPFKSRA
jgi:hypothetical protein